MKDDDVISQSRYDENGNVKKSFSGKILIVGVVGAILGACVGTFITQFSGQPAITNIMGTQLPNELVFGLAGFILAFFYAAKGLKGKSQAKVTYHVDIDSQKIELTPDADVDTPPLGTANAKVETSLQFDQNSALGAVANALLGITIGNENRYVRAFAGFIMGGILGALGGALVLTKHWYRHDPRFIKIFIAGSAFVGAVAVGKFYYDGRSFLVETLQREVKENEAQGADEEEIDPLGFNSPIRKTINIAVIFVGLGVLAVAGYLYVADKRLNYSMAHPETQEPASPISTKQPVTVDDYRELAEKGNADAELQLGRMYFKGQGVEKNDAEAFKWLLKSAKQGNANAENKVGYMYNNGMGVARDDAVANEWYTKAAYRGDSDAECNLGLNYTADKSGKRYYEGLRWLVKSGEQHNACAQKALDFYAQLSEPQYGFVQAEIGVVYQGEGAGQYQEALKWFRLSAAKGSGLAQMEIARMFLRNQGATQADWDSLPQKIKDEAKAN